MRFLDLRDGEGFEEYAKRSLEYFAANDHLGKAAAARDKARAAETLQDYDGAWKFYHEQKEQYLQHARRNRFTAAQTLALDASVSESLANVLRLQGKQHDALVHILYWVSASGRRTKNQEKKLVAYFNRCNFQGVNEAGLRRAVDALSAAPEFRAAKNVVNSWSLCT